MTIKTTTRNLIETHSQKYLQSLKDTFIETHSTIKRNLVHRSHDLKDDVIAMYLMLYDLEIMQSQKMEELKQKESLKDADSLIESLFKYKAFHTHVLNVLTSIHHEFSIEETLKQMQFYQGVERFIPEDSIIPAGLNILIENVNQEKIQGFMISFDQPASYKAIITNAYKELFDEEEDLPFVEMIQQLQVHILKETYAREFFETQPGVKIIELSNWKNRENNQELKISGYKFG